MLFSSLLLLVCLSYFFDVNKSQLVECNGDFVDICGSISSSTCEDAPASYMGNDYDCSIITEGCACSEQDISESVVFLIDGTGRSQLTDAQNDFFWNFTVSFWPRRYKNEVASNQKLNGNVNYHFIIFGSSIEYEYEYTLSNPSVPWNGQETLPDNLKNARGNADFCVAYNRAKEIFESDGKTQRSIVYVAYSDPSNYQCDLADYDINFFLIKWTDETDSDGSIYDYFTQNNGNNALNQCAYQFASSTWFPDDFNDGVAVHRLWQEITSDFFCAAGGCYVFFLYIFLFVTSFTQKRFSLFFWYY